MKNNREINMPVLGSFETITDEIGQVVEKLSFDPWGRRRNPTDWTYNNVPKTYLFDRGFTGHEHLDNFDLINMNGRVYDPWLGRFLSPDPFVQAPTYSQNFNRYSYALNNPLKYVDPSGYYFGPAKDVIDEGYYDLGSQGSYGMDYLRGVDSYFYHSPFVNNGFARLDAQYDRNKLNLVQKGTATFSGVEAQELFKIMAEYNIQTVNGVFESYAFMQYNKQEAAMEFLAELNTDFSGAETMGLKYPGGDPVEGVSFNFAISCGIKGMVNGITISILKSENDWGITLTALKNGDGYETTLIGVSYVHMSTTDGSDMTIEKAYEDGWTYSMGVYYGSWSKSGNNGEPIPSTINIDEIGLSYGAPIGFSRYDTYTWGVTINKIRNIFNF